MMINIAAVQFCSGPDPERNLMDMRGYLGEAMRAAPRPDLVVFPEYARLGPGGAGGRISLDGQSEFIDAMRRAAVEHSVNIIPGTFAEEKGGKTYNTAVFIGRDGEIKGVYRKIHLMVASSYDESRHVAAGEELCVVEADFGRVGLMICYDLRFPELAIALCERGADMLVAPAMFPLGQALPTRVDDWDLLTRGTALMTVTHVVAVNQYGAMGGQHPFGRTCVVDPRGAVIAAAGARCGVVHAGIDLEYQRQARAALAVWENRRKDLY